MKALLALAVVTLSAASFSIDDLRAPARRVSSACIAMTNAETSVLLDAAAMFTSDTTSRGHLTYGIPAVDSDSISVVADSAACAVADSSYRVWRSAQGKPNVSIPTALTRLGSTGFYFGTSFIATDPFVYQFVILDSSFAVIGSVTYSY
jgi:hypothetical protein